MTTPEDARAHQSGTHTLSPAYPVHPIPPHALPAGATIVKTHQRTVELPPVLYALLGLISVLLTIIASAAVYLAYWFYTLAKALGEMAAEWQRLTQTLG